MNQDENMKDGKYEEALERARQGLPIDKIFPELYESEDERTRKNCIHFLELQKAHHADTSEIDDCIAYLERQKEQKPEVKDPFNDEQFCRGYEAGKHDAMREQKPAEWSEEDRDYYDTIVSKLEVIGDDSGLSNNQIEFLREHCPLHCFEWSEDGERKLNRIYEIIGHAADDKGFLTSKRIIGDNEAIELQDFLKSLRPQPSWKPSEEQMEALMLAIEGKCDPTSYMSRRLEDLYEALANEFHVECKLDK